MTVHSQAADIIERHIDAKFRKRDRAEGAANELHDAGILREGRTNNVGSTPPAEAAVYILQCRMSWPTAEAIVAELATAGLLREGN